MNLRAYKDAYRCCMQILALRPEFADAHFLLGMIADAHGQTQKALPLIDRALGIDPTNAEYLAHRARCLILRNRDSEALESAMRALESAGDDARVLDTIGVVLSKAGAHEEAVNAFERAVRIQSREPQYYFNMAASQQFMGNFVAAEASYEAAIRLRPDFYRAHWALTELGRATPERNHIERLERLWESAGADADGALYLGHALAKEHEELGHYAKAFDCWERGKRGKRDSLQFDIAHYRGLFDAMTRLCSAEFMASRQPGHASSEPIFIVGMPRTGTTLVERILASHDDVFAAGELDEFGLCVKRMTATPSQQILDVETIRSAGALDFADLGRAYVESTRPRTGRTKHFIDKMPPNFLYAGLIHRALPNAKIICLKRNPLDTCLSNYRQLFSINAPYYNYAYDLLDTGRYYLMFDDLVRHWQESLSSDFLVVHYEAVVDDAEAESRKLLEFCGLSWDPKVLRFHESSASVATASAVQVRDPIHARAVRRWRHYVDQLQPLIALFESHGIDYEAV